MLRVCNSIMWLTRVLQWVVESAVWRRCISSYRETSTNTLPCLHLDSAPRAKCLTLIFTLVKKWPFTHGLLPIRFFAWSHFDLIRCVSGVSSLIRVRTQRTQKIQGLATGWRACEMTRNTFLANSKFLFCERENVDNV